MMQSEEEPRLSSAYLRKVGDKTDPTILLVDLAQLPSGSAINF